MIIQAKWSSKCGICKQTIDKGATCEFDTELRAVYHLECVPEEGYAVNEQDELADRLNYRNYTLEQLTNRVNPDKGD